MSADQDTQDLIKRVTEATVKAVSARDDVSVAFAPGAHGLSHTEEGSQARLPTPTRKFNPGELKILRGEADAAALRLRYHDPKVFNRQRPGSANSSELFDAAEQARVEALGSRFMAGVAENLDGFHEDRCRQKGYHLAMQREQSQIADAVGLLLREKLTGQPLPPSAAPLMEFWRPWLEDKAGNKISELKSCLHDQEAFGESIRHILEDLDMPADSEGEGESEENSPSEDQDEEQDMDHEDGADGAAELASSEAYEEAGIGPDDLSVVELHDASAPGEIFAYEYLGLCPKGEGGKLVSDGVTKLGGRLPVNTSGGLLRKGHPVGATGIAQIVELTEQLQGRAGERQVDGAKVGLAHNGGGSIGNDAAAMCVTILSR